MTSSRAGRFTVADGAHLLALLAVLLVVLFPFIWMVLTSFKNPTDIFRSPPVLLFTPTLSHYREALLDYGVGNNLYNSLVVAAATTLLALLLGTPAAYALSRYDFRGKRDLWFWFITNRMISPVVLVIPFFLLAQRFGLLNTRLIVVLVHLTFTLPIVVWICADQFRTVPRALDEAAWTDGAGPFTIFWRIILPLGLPGVVVAGILSFIFSWNDLLYALMLTRAATQTAPVAATSFMSGYQLPWGRIMATATLIVLPSVAFALVVSRHLVRGLTMGAVK